MFAFRKSLAIVAVFALLAPATFPSVLAGESVRLRYRLAPEARYEQHMTMGTTMHVEIEGLSPEQAAMLGGMLGQDMQQDMAMTLILDTGPTGADGGVPFDMYVERLVGAMTIGEQRIPLPEAEPDVRMKGRLGPDGRKLELDTSGMDALADMLPTDVVDRLLKMTPPFPDRALELGDALTVPQSYEIPFPGMPDAALRIDGVTIFTLRGIEPGAATFDVESNAAMSADGQGASGMDMSLSGGGRGTAVFDAEQGLFSRITIDMSIEMSVNLAAELAQAEGASAGPVLMTMSMKGPVEITMSRAED